MYNYFRFVKIFSLLVLYFSFKLSFVFYIKISFLSCTYFDSRTSKKPLKMLGIAPNRNKTILSPKDGMFCYKYI